MRNSHSIYTSTRNAIAILTLVIVNSCITNAQTFINKGFTQLSFDNATQEIHENIYNYNFAKADTLLHNYTVKTNKSNWSKLIYINYYWWQILVS